MKRQVLTKSRSTVKPNLTDVNKASRVSYCKSFVDKRGYFKSMLNCIDIDKKWWCITTVKLSYIIVPGKQAPDRKVKHKS